MFEPSLHCVKHPARWDTRPDSQRACIAEKLASRVDKITSGQRLTCSTAARCRSPARGTSCLRVQGVVVEARERERESTSITSLSALDTLPHCSRRFLKSIGGLRVRPDSRSNYFIQVGQFLISAMEKINVDSLAPRLHSRVRIA